VREGARRAVARGLSVRELEALSRGKRRRKKATRKRRTEDPVLREWEERLQRTLGTQVRIERMGIEGTIRIEYYSDEDLERILEVLGSLG
jgi:ParB family chromosome partitioning protein